MLSDQRRHLESLASYWLERLYLNLPPSASQNNTIYLFSLAILSRLDFSQKWKVAPHPIDQAIKFALEYKAEQLDVGALQWEKRNKTLGDLQSFLDYFPQLDTLRESMTAGQQAGTSSASPSQHNKQ